MTKNAVISPAIQRRMDAEENALIAFPQLFRFSLSPDTTFRGLTVFLGDNNAVVVGVKSFDEAGKPLVMWSSGTDLLDALRNLEQSFISARWRPDKHYKH